VAAPLLLPPHSLDERDMRSIISRLRRLEASSASGRCPECPGGRHIVVVYDDAASRDASEERCQRCGRAATVLRVVYDD
jgi:hypothetical protein